MTTDKKDNNEFDEQYVDKPMNQWTSLIVWLNADGSYKGHSNDEFYETKEEALKAAKNLEGEAVKNGLNVVHCAAHHEL